MMFRAVWIIFQDFPEIFSRAVDSSMSHASFSNVSMLQRFTKATHKKYTFFFIFWDKHVPSAAHLLKMWRIL